MLRVAYSDIDKMEFVHHSNYLKYYENARWEAMRELGIPYNSIEESGIYMPVISMQITYIKPAFYDEVLTVNTTIKEMPAVTIKFYYELINELGELINKAEITLAFIKSLTLKPCHPPEYCIDVLRKFILEKNIVV